MARPRQFDYGDVLEKMKVAFWEHGFNGISMDDVGQVADMNRGSIYNAFGDKRALYLAALDLYGQQYYFVAAQLIQDSRSAQSAVRDLYNAAFKGMSGDKAQWGCLICNAAVEVAPVDQEVSDLVRRYLGLLSKAFLNSLQASHPKAQDAVLLKNLAEQLTASYVGFNIMARAGVATACLRRIADSAVEMSVVRH